MLRSLRQPTQSSIINHQSSILNPQSSILNPQSAVNSKEEVMCPACMASAALMAGSVVSTGGIAALAVKVVRGIKGGQKETSKHNIEQPNIEQSIERRNENGDHDNE
jgi:hypothetical protein